MKRTIALLATVAALALAGLSPAGTRPDDRPGPRGPGALTPATATVVTVSEAFDWTDAAIGALAGLGTALVGGGLILSGARLRKNTAWTGERSMG